MDVNTSRADLLPGMLEAVLRGGPAPAGADEAGGRLEAARQPFRPESAPLSPRRCRAGRRSN